MKRTLLLIAVALFVSSTAFSQFKFGVGAVGGTKAGIEKNTETKLGFGINARADIEINDKLSATGGFTYYLPTKYADLLNYKLQIFTFNAGAKLYLLEGEKSKLYGYGGFSWVQYKETSDIKNLTQKGTGFEFGGGIEFGSFFAEAKYETKLEQIVGVVGIYF